MDKNIIVKPKDQIATVKKNPRTDVSIDNSTYEFKRAYEVKDEYGNIETFYRKDFVLCTAYDNQLNSKIADLGKQLLKLQAEKAEVDKLI